MIAEGQVSLLREGKAHLVSRRRNSLNERFPELREFDALRSRRRKCSVVLYAFDLLHLDGYDLTACPLIKRKALLKKILPKDNTGRIRFTDHVIGNGEALFRKVEALNLECVMMKARLQCTRVCETATG